jgi:endonuclease III
VGEPSRLERLVDDLKQFYGLLPAPPADAFALFVWDTLSFQTTPQKRDLAFASLKRHRALTPDAMSRVAPKALEDSVKLAGAYFEQRLRALRAAVQVFQRHPDLPAALKGPLHSAEEAARLLPQTSDGGSDRMLLFAGTHRVLPMDTGTARVVRRLGYHDMPDAELPHSLDVYRRVSAYLSHHAISTCTDADPHCPVCPLLHDCPTGQAAAR